MKALELHNDDALAVLKNTPNQCVDLVLVDPPYFRVLDDVQWDNQWRNDADYLAWLESCVIEFKRILKPNGSLYLFCSARLCSDTELLISKHLRILNQIVWAKPSGRWQGTKKEVLRRYFSSNERIIFAEHYNNATVKGTHQAACLSLKKDVFSPLTDYFIQAKQASGLSNNEINHYMGNQMAGHWFGKGQWQLPNEDQYKKLQQLFSEKSCTLQEHEGLQHAYKTLSQEYHTLKNEFESLRRPFVMDSSKNCTDTWYFKSPPNYKGRHPCEKPAAMMEHIISTSSRPNDLVADFFMGSGSTGKAALKLGRKFIGVELETARFEQTKREFQKLGLVH